jgi:hypothetical protein
MDDPYGGREIMHGAARIDIYEACKVVLVAFKNEYPQHFGDCDLTGL